MSFHVPESGRQQDAGDYSSDSTFGNNGAFRLASCEPGWILAILASDGMGWEHVSVHARTGSGKLRTPTWKEMCQVKREFWDAEDCVLQFHPPEADYVNNHANVLHLWRPISGEFPRPESIMV